MSTGTKLHLHDIPELRAALERIHSEKTQTQLIEWSIKLSDHLFALVGYDHLADPAIQESFWVVQLLQNGQAGVPEVRRAGFQVHRLAKACTNPVLQAVLRAAGHAVSTGHMREHAMVASDYAILTLNRMLPDELGPVRAERLWQIAAFT